MNRICSTCIFLWNLSNKILLEIWNWNCLVVMLRWAYNYCNTHYMWNVVAIGLNTPFHSCFCTLYNRFHIFYGLKLGSAASLNNCFRGKCHVRAYANQRICHLLYDYMICILSSTSFFFDLFFMLVMIINTYYIM